MDVCAVAVFTGCYRSEAALVLLSSPHIVTVYLSLSHPPPPALCVISLARLFVQLFSLLVIFAFFKLPNISTLPSPPQCLLSCPVSPHTLLFSSSLHSPCESQGRNRRGCQLDERGRAGPADPVYAESP